MRKSTCFCLVEYNLYFIMRPFLFQVIKALSRNSITATMLGKDVVATFANKIIPKMAAHAEKKSTFVAKLRVSLETLHYLTKPSKYWKWDSYVLLTYFLSIKNPILGSNQLDFLNMFRKFRKNMSPCRYMVTNLFISLIDNTLCAQKELLLSYFRVKYSFHLINHSLITSKEQQWGVN